MKRARKRTNPSANHHLVGTMSLPRAGVSSPIRTRGALTSSQAADCSSPDTSRPATQYSRDTPNALGRSIQAWGFALSSAAFGWWVLAKAGPAQHAPNETLFLALLLLVRVALSCLGLIRDRNVHRDARSAAEFQASSWKRIAAGKETYIDHLHGLIRHMESRLDTTSRLDPRLAILDEPLVLEPERRRPPTSPFPGLPSPDGRDS